MVRLGDASSYNTLGCGGMKRRKQKGIRDIKGALWGGESKREESRIFGDFDEYNREFLHKCLPGDKFLPLQSFFS